MSTTKDTIYIDVDDEITSIIDKVQNAQEGLVALVLPKRAAMLQSSVNMKLLKRASEKSKKNLVLITTEAGLLPLASSVGIYVAKNLQSKPTIPKVAVTSSAIDELVKAGDEEPKSDFDPKAAGGLAVGELAGDSIDDKAPAKPELTPLAYKRASDEEEPVMLDNSDKTEEKTDDKDKKVKKDKSLKVPNFERFRTWLIIGVLLIILLIIGFIIANKVLPKALISISTNTSSVNSTLAMTLSPTTTSLNTSQLIVPANLQQTQQTASKQVATTGQKNDGTPATGNVSFTLNTDCQTKVPNNVVIPAGVGITSSSSSGSFVFITQKAANNWAATKTACQWTSNSVSVISQTLGSLGSNLPSSGAQFSVPNSAITYSSSQGSATAVAIGGSAFADGQNNLVQVVSQADINSATAAITMPVSSTTKSTLTAALKAAGFDPIVATYSAGAPVTTNSANVGDAATTVTVTETITYTMFGVKESNLNTLITNSVDQQINTTKQTIQDTGLNQSAYTNFVPTSGGGTITMTTSSTVGPHLNIAALKAQIAGMKKGDLETTIEQNPGVTGVTVKYSPFWVSGTPKNITKITIDVKKAT
jgi:hypothetical protein